MRHVRMLGLCLAAVFAVVALTATAASAASPEWGKCEAQVGGKYKDANCQEKAKKGAGAYEWHKGSTLANVPFSGEGQGGGGILWGGQFECDGIEGKFTATPTSRSKCVEEGGKYHLNGELGIECEKENNTGEASGKNDVVNVHVTFEGCALFGLDPCNTRGDEEGEIQTNVLKGELGVINKTSKDVGLLLEPATKHATFATLLCGGNKNIEIRVGVGNKKDGAYSLPENKGGDDQVISPITPVNKMTSKFTQVYTSPESFTEIENIPNKFEGKARSSLEVTENIYEPPEDKKVFGQTMWSSAGEEITNVNTAEKPGEIKY